MVTKTFLEYVIQVKVKWSRYKPRVDQRVGTGITLLFHNHSTRRGEWSAVRTGRTYPPGKNRYPFYRRLGGPQGRSGRAENLVPTGIRSTDRPASSQSLYRLSYPAHFRICNTFLQQQWLYEHASMVRATYTAPLVNIWHITLRFQCLYNYDVCPSKYVIQFSPIMN